MRCLGLLTVGSGNKEQHPIITPLTMGIELASCFDPGQLALLVTSVQLLSLLHYNSSYTQFIAHTISNPLFFFYVITWVPVKYRWILFQRQTVDLQYCFWKINKPACYTTNEMYPREKESQGKIAILVFLISFLKVLILWWLPSTQLNAMPTSNSFL